MTKIFAWLCGLSFLAGFAFLFTSVWVGDTESLIVTGTLCFPLGVFWMIAAAISMIREDF